MSAITKKSLADKGINIDYNARFMDYDHNQTVLAKDGRINYLSLDSKKTAAGLRNKNNFIANDSNTAILAPNVGFPLPALTLINPNIIPVLVSNNVTESLLPNEVSGTIATEKQVFTLKEFYGETQEYSDFSTPPESDVNYNYVVRDPYFFETHIQYGDRQVAKSTEAQVNLVADKQAAMALTISKRHEFINLYGVEGRAIHGFLNCPDFAEELTALNVTLTGGTKSTKWDDKVKDAEGCATHISNDVMEMFSDIVSRTKNLVSRNDEFTLLIPPKDLVKLSAANGFGLSALTNLKTFLPNLEVIALPNLDTDNGEGRKIMLFPKSIASQRVGSIQVIEKLTMRDIVREAKRYIQCCRAGTFGTILEQPMAFSVMAIS